MLIFTNIIYIKISVFTLITDKLVRLFIHFSLITMNYFKTKWASLVSYGMASNILEDVLPMHANISSIFHTTHKVAKQLDAAISDEKRLHTHLRVS